MTKSYYEVYEVFIIEVYSFYMSFDDFSVSFRGSIDLAPSGLEANTHVLELRATVGLRRD